MAYQILNLTLISATDLKKVTFFSRMRVYAVASISGGDPCTRSHGTHVDFHGDRNPTWNAMLQLPIPTGADVRGLALHVLLRARAPFFGRRDVGEVFVPLTDLLSGADDGGDPRTMSYQVRRPLTGRAHGVLYFSYKFTDVKPDLVAPSIAAKNKEEQYVEYPGDHPEMAVANKAMAPVTAYPPQSQAPLAYPLSSVPYGAPYVAYTPQPYGYASPPPYGYNPAPAPAMYGYAPPPMAAPARHRGGMGMGLGLGLLGGAVGGMMLGEEIGDFEADAAYDAGFSDGLSF